MRKLSKVITAILLVIIVLIANENILPSATGTDYYIATADLNVRTGAGTEYPIFFTLQKGDEVEILSKNDNWYQIRYIGKKGYAYSEYLKYSKTVSNTNSHSFRPTNSHSFQPTISYIVRGILAGIILLVGFIIFRKIRDIKLLKTVTKLNRGTRSERDLTLNLLKHGILAQMIFHDLYLKKYNGGFSQIDLVVITEVGIIVFEVKDYSGWIFGSGNQSNWTQVLAYGKEKYRFYNPIMQNNKHIDELRKKIKPFDNVPFYSIVLFYGNCVLKDINFVPNGIFIVKSNRVLEVMEIITKKNEPFQYSNKDEIVMILKDAVKNGEYTENQIQHIENVKDMLGKERVFD
jgi:uncharacterized protein YraI